MSTLSFQSLVFTTFCCLLWNDCAGQENKTNATYLSTTSFSKVNKETMIVKEAPQAVANITPTKKDLTQTNQVYGRIMFTKVANGVRIVADLEGLTPGEHGFHIHEFGDCSQEGEGAGGHFNPTKQKHGGPNSSERHIGDLGNIIADIQGNAHYDRIDSVISLSGEHSIIGHSIIIHADPDDYTTQPTGKSGKKIGCGLIEAVTIQ